MVALLEAELPPPPPDRPDHPFFSPGREAARRRRTAEMRGRLHPRRSRRG